MLDRLHDRRTARPTVKRFQRKYTNVDTTARGSGTVVYVAPSFYLFIFGKCMTNRCMWLEIGQKAADLGGKASPGLHLLQTRTSWLKIFYFYREWKGSDRAQRRCSVCVDQLIPNRESDRCHRCSAIPFAPKFGSGGTERRL